jgi:hypothetical protein
LLGRAARCKNAIEVPVDELSSLREVALALRRADEGAEVDDRAVPLDGVAMLPRHGVEDLLGLDGHAVPANGQREDDRRGLAVGPELGEPPDALLVLSLALLEQRARIILRPPVDELVALKAQQHQVFERVDVGRSLPVRPTRAVLLEGDDVGLLGERAVLLRQGVRQRVLVAELAAACCPGI